MITSTGEYIYLSKWHRPNLNKFKYGQTVRIKKPKTEVEKAKRKKTKRCFFEDGMEDQRWKVVGHPNKQYAVLVPHHVDINDDSPHLENGTCHIVRMSWVEAPPLTFKDLME